MARFSFRHNQRLMTGYAVFAMISSLTVRLAAPSATTINSHSFLRHHRYFGCARLVDYVIPMAACCDHPYQTSDTFHDFQPWVSWYWVGWSCSQGWGRLAGRLLSIHCPWFVGLGRRCIDGNRTDFGCIPVIDGLLAGKIAVIANSCLLLYSG